MFSNKKISIVSLLRLLIFLGILGLIMPLMYGVNSSYINNITIVLTLALSAISIAVLKDAERQSNPLLIILIWWVVFFFVFRVITLNYTDYSVCLRRSDATALDLNKGLGLVLACVVVLWLTLRFPFKRLFSSNDIQIRYKPGYITKALAIYWIAFIINIAAEYNTVLTEVALIIKNFLLNIYFLLFFLISYSILVWDRIEKRDKIKLAVSLMAFVIFVTLNGSRSGFYTIFKMLFFVFLTLGYKRIKKWYIYFGLLIAPALVYVFVFSTYIRQMDLLESSVSEKIEIMGSMNEYTSQFDTRVLLGPVFDRIGYLDYTTEMVVKRDDFKSFVNVGYEIQSIIDNSLTPGFDIFHVPRVSNIISNSYEYSSKDLLSKRASRDLEYHSDELTAFGECYILFGFPLCILIISLIGLLFRKLWLVFDNKNNENGVFLKAMLLYLFEVFLSSYGIDWLTLDVICFVMTYLIFNTWVFGKSKR